LFHFSVLFHSFSISLERDIGFEPMTFSLATKHSTTELIPHTTTYKVRNNGSIQANSRITICNIQMTTDSPQEFIHEATNSDYNSQVYIVEQITIG
jgi:actin-like ATPase involved in cell morphogenesis